MESRRITDLGKEEYSKAANTVLHNTYVDDIVDSENWSLRQKG